MTTRDENHKGIEMNIPNILTIARVIAIPLFMATFAFQKVIILYLFIV